ncbi:hypothetical protein HYALB_00011260 [Hymenoscyphus albidus]|uniref:Complex 1 LYR protein domain-containing protein n=1 Tax=Hymenoscyphus albidus TaxID=595503 RepID=A0A9N9LWN1_9HELO|nr:hypothetical protein HYALB_00011260 [Hymenoscyphus albidus]
MLPHRIVPSCSPWKGSIFRGLSLQLIPARPYVSKPGAPKRPSRFGDKHISLDHFLLRGRVVSLYRDIIRGCRRITNPSSKKEMIDMARYEFKRNKDVQDLVCCWFLSSSVDGRGGIPSYTTAANHSGRRRYVIYFLPEEHNGREWNGILTDYDHGDCMLSEI